MHPQITTQPDLFPDRERDPQADVEWFVKFLAERDWMFAREVLAAVGQPPTEDAKRWVRGLADRSGGRVASGQRGYRLTLRMTSQEFHTARNTLAHQATELQRRVLEMDKVFYTRPPVAVSAGVLDSGNDKLSDGGHKTL